MNIYFVCSPDRLTFAWGQTERTYSERHKDTDWNKLRTYLRARGEDIILLEWYENVDITDHKIHSFLRKQPHIDQLKRGEWASYNQEVYTLDEIKYLVEKKFLIEQTKESLTLRNHQQKFVEKYKKAKLSCSDSFIEFLLGAKPRSGKSPAVLTVINEFNYKLTLIVARYRSPKQSFNEDISKFDNFSNMIYVDLSDKDYLNQIDRWMNTDKNIVVFGCIQSLKRIVNIDHDINFVVYDEAHEGYKSPQWMKLYDHVNCDIVYASGTPFDLVEDFNKDLQFNYSYYEEQLDKKKGLNNAPSMTVIRRVFDGKEKETYFQGISDSIKNIFNVKDGEFINPTLVQSFVSSEFGNQKTLLPQQKLFKDTTHIFCCLPSVNACHAIVKYFKGTRFAPLVVTGETSENSDTINKHIDENPNGTIILTVSANVLGVTLKNIDTIVNLRPGESLKYWLQLAFRGGSSDKDWRVIDYDPERCLTLGMESWMLASDACPEVAQYEYADFVNLFDWCSGFSELNQDKVNDILASNMVGDNSFTSRVPFNPSNIKDVDFELEQKPSKEVIKKKVQVSSNSTNGETNKKKVNDSSNHDNSNDIRKLNTIKSIIERMPLVLFYMIRSGETVSNIDSILQSDTYSFGTNDTENILKDALNCDIINRKSLNLRIQKDSIYIKSNIKKDECSTLEMFSHSIEKQKSMPVKLIDDLFSL